jgi:ubiquitin carboxyl-terminal hydrolase 8
VKYFYSSFYRLCATADRLFGQAEQHKASGDEELSYIFYMKYLAIVSMVQRLEEYKMERDHFNQLLGGKNIKNALDMAEMLSDSLQQR